MEFVLDTPLHLDSLWRPVLDVTRTVNHLVSIKINSAIMMFMRMKIIMREREAYCKVVAISAGSQRIPLPAEISR